MYPLSTIVIIPMCISTSLYSLHQFNSVHLYHAYFCMLILVNFRFHHVTFTLMYHCHHAQ